MGLRVTLETNQMYEFAKKGVQNQTKTCSINCFCCVFPPIIITCCAAFAVVMFDVDKSIGELYP